MRGIGLALCFGLASVFSGGDEIVRAEQRPPVLAEGRSVAIVGDVKDSTINVGVTPEEHAALIRPYEELSEARKKLIAKLEAELDLNQKQVRNALETVNEANVPPEQLAAKLVDISKQYKDLQMAATAQPGDGAKITVLKAEVQKAIQDGQLDKADEILAEVVKIQEERPLLNAAQTTAQRGDVAMARLRFVDAAKWFAGAAAKVPEGHDEECWKYLDASAYALYLQGVEFGDHDAALSAIERFRHLAELRPRNAFPLDWAKTQNHLGNALWRLGERENGTAQLEEAVAAFREALKERTRERVPLDWARTQNNLGNALERLGERESGTARLQEAVTAFHEALKERTRARVPLLWATTQTNLGLALAALGERETGTERLEEAITTYREVLMERARERVPLQWAATQMYVGVALEMLGERESDTARLEAAVAAFHEALQEFTPARVPLYWATAQMNLGTALRRLGERETGTARLEEAVAAFRGALQEFTPERVPRQWAMTQMNLGSALVRLGERESGTERLEEAVAAYREALQELTRERVPPDWAASTGSQGVALMLLAERRRDAKMAKLAVRQIEAAFTTSRDGGNAPSAAYYKAQLPQARALVQNLAKR